MKKLLVLFIFLIFVSCTKEITEIKNFRNPKYGELFRNQLKLEKLNSERIQGK